MVEYEKLKDRIDRGEVIVLDGTIRLVQDGSSATSRDSAKKYMEAASPPRNRESGGSHL